MVSVLRFGAGILEPSFGLKIIESVFAPYQEGIRLNLTDISHRSGYLAYAKADASGVSVVIKGCMKKFCVMDGHLTCLKRHAHRRCGIYL